MERLFDDLPLWGVFVATLLLVLAAVEAGYRLARQRQKVHELEKEAPVGAMVGATLGLLAFLLAFTFGIAADAFHARKEALVKEASAIRMTYLLSDVTPEAHRSEIRTGECLNFCVRGALRLFHGGGRRLRRTDRRGGKVGGHITRPSW